MKNVERIDVRAEFVISDLVDQIDSSNNYTFVDKNCLFLERVLDDDDFRYQTIVEILGIMDKILTISEDERVEKETHGCIKFMISRVKLWNTVNLREHNGYIFQ